jgi:membrane protein
MYYVIKFFWRGLQKGSLNIRASAIAFNFLLAMGPASIFLLTLIPYFPMQNSQNEILTILKNMMPDNAFLFVESTLNELTVKRSGLQFFGFATAVFFSTKGISAMIASFNATYHVMESRSYIQQKLVAIVLVLIFSTLIISSVPLMLFSKFAMDKMVEYGLVKVNFIYYLIIFLKWVIIFFMIFFANSFLYYLAPQRKMKWTFISPGSSLSTILIILVSILFSYFMNNFAQLNRIFGSVGALIALMLWLNFIALSLLIGFELNVSIKNARLNNNELLEME